MSGRERAEGSARRAPATRRGGAVPVRGRRLWALLALAAAWGAQGCTAPVPAAPYPSTVRVEHPLRAPEGMDYEGLLERYSVSPERNPDGLGVLGTVWLNSYMTLLTRPALEKREERNRIAFARNPAEQRAVLGRLRALLRERWIFEGVLVGDLRRALRMEFYRPEGIYLVDDAGRKFLPLSVSEAEPVTAPSVGSEFGIGHYSLPRLEFPAAAITPSTRAVSLYFAALQKRVRFTWIFDPDYEWPRGRNALEGARGNRLFRRE